MKYLLVFGILFCSIFVNAQSVSFLFKGNVSNTTSKKVESGVTVSIIQDGSTINSATTGADGNYTVKGNVNYKKTFSVVFSKSGFVSQRVNFNYLTLNEEDLPAGADYQPLPKLNASIFSAVPNTDFSFLTTEPVEIYTWNSTKAAPDLDVAAKGRTKDKIDKILGTAATNSATNDANYNAAISAADRLFNEKKYDEAMYKYEEALGFRQNDSYAIKRIEDIDILKQQAKTEQLVDQQENQAYYDLIKAADLLRDQKKFEQAIEKYKEALLVRDEQKPKDEIAKLQTEIKYNEAFKQAEAFYNQKSWKAAKEKYLIAKDLKPSEQLPITRLADIEKKMALATAEKEKKQKYDDAMAAAEILFTEEKYAEAKAKYTEALTYESASTSAAERITACDVKIAEAAKEQERLAKIQKLLTEGKTVFDQSKWNEAKIKYEEVISLDENNPEAKLKLDEIAVKLAEVADLAAKEAKFIKLVGEGDLAAKGLKFTEAKAKYEEAIDLKKDDAVQLKLDNVNKQILDAEQKAKLENDFQQLKSEGFQLASEQKLEEAKVKLTAALAIHADIAVSQKLKEVEDKIKADAALSQNETDYQNLLAEAKTLELANKLDEAIAKYGEAQQKKPTEPEPKDKIAELQKIKLNLAKQKEIDTQYADYMRKGDEFMAQKNYLAAIKEYNNANGLKPAEKEPVDKAAEAERLAKENLDEKNKIFENILAAAQTKLDEKDYAGARQYIDRAIKAQPEDKRPQELLKQVQQIEEKERNYALKLKEAEQYATTGNFTKAVATFEEAKKLKPEDTIPQRRIDELTQLQNEAANAAQQTQLYQEYMTKGAGSLISENYEQALIHFQNALSIKKDDQIALAKITEVQGILDDIANSRKSESEKKNKFEQFVQSGDAQVLAQDYASSVKSYEDALAIFPNNSEVRMKLEAAKHQALEKILNDQNAAYQSLLSEADAFFQSKSYDKARTSYENAKLQRPDDQYPTQKLKEIDAILNPVMASSSSLDNLGESSGNSVMDGYALLQKAQYDRENLKSSKIEDQINAIKNNESELMEIRQSELNATENSINRILEQIGQSEVTDDSSKREIVDAIVNVEKMTAKVEQENDYLSTADHQRAQEKIDLIQQESSTDYAQRDTVYRENNSILEGAAIDASSTITDLELSENETNINTSKRLDIIDQHRGDEVNQNLKDRQDADLEIEKVLVYTATLDQLKSNKNQEENIDNQEHLNSIEVGIGLDVDNDAKQPNENNAELVKIEGALLNSTSAQSAEAEEKTADNVEKVNEFLDMASRTEEERNENHKENLDRIESTVASIDEQQYQDYLAENEKYLKNKNEINTIQEDISAEEKTANVKHSELVNSVLEVEQSSNEVTVNAIENDDKERQRATERIEQIDKSVSKNTQESTDKQIDNVNNINAVSNAAEKSISESEKERLNITQANQAKLDQIETTQPEKVYMVNSLGKEFPEGVSQEIFNQKDQDGLLTAVITRRVVVTNGEGNVYVRTQTLYSVTYAKNGVATTEYVWQKETQNGKLKRNY
jgi:epidermal growth factor receptor substrate 15